LGKGREEEIHNQYYLQDILGKGKYKKNGD
jgi:hypothetical protein